MNEIKTPEIRIGDTVYPDYLTGPDGTRYDTAKFIRSIRAEFLDLGDQIQDNIWTNCLLVDRAVWMAKHSLNSHYANRSILNIVIASKQYQDKTGNQKFGESDLYPYMSGFGVRYFKDRSEKAIKAGYWERVGIRYTITQKGHQVLAEIEKHYLNLLKIHRNE